MAPPPDKSRAAEPALWAFGVSLVLLVGPVRSLWATPERGWLAPFLLLAGASLALVYRARARSRRAGGATLAPLSEVERRRLDRLLEGSEGKEQASAER